jgi:hypothetical protein
MKDDQAALRLVLAKQKVARHIAKQYGFDYEEEVAKLPASGKYHDLYFLEAWARAIEKEKTE